MTNHLTPTAKTLLAAALTASALLGLSACGSAAAKPSAAAAAVANTPTATQSQQSPAQGAPTTNQAPNVADASTQTPDQNQDKNQDQDQSENKNQDQNQTPPAPATTNPADPKPSQPAKPSTPKPSTTADPALPGDCSPDHLKGTVTTLARPINHVLLTVTNTGGTACSVYYYPGLRFDPDQQAVIPVIQDSQPQAVVTIDPGQSAYASIGTSAADSSAGKAEPQVEVFLEARDQSGSLPGSLTLPLPAGTVVDQNSAFVTYWQSAMKDAIAW